MSCAFKKMSDDGEMRDNDVLQQEFIDLLKASDGELSDMTISQHFGQRYEGLVPIINNMSSQKRLTLMFDADNILHYKLQNEEKVEKMKKLGADEARVYEVCEKAGNKGIWTRDIKREANVSQHTLKKAIKVLESRRLIKSVRSVASKSKKLYMLYDMKPAKEITGGPWYADQEFDFEFVRAIREFLEKEIRTMKMATSTYLFNALNERNGILVELQLNELEAVLQTMLCDGVLEVVHPATQRILYLEADAGENCEWYHSTYP